MTSVMDATPSIGVLVRVRRGREYFTGTIDTGPFGCDIWWFEETDKPLDFTLVRETDDWEPIKGDKNDSRTKITKRA